MMLKTAVHSILVLLLVFCCVVVNDGWRGDCRRSRGVASLTSSGRRGTSASNPNGWNVTRPDKRFLTTHHSPLTTAVHPPSRDSAWSSDELVACRLLLCPDCVHGCPCCHPDRRLPYDPRAFVAAMERDSHSPGLARRRAQKPGVRRRRPSAKEPISARLVLDHRLRGDVGVLSDDLAADLFPGRLRAEEGLLVLSVLVISCGGRQA